MFHRLVPAVIWPPVREILSLRCPLIDEPCAVELGLVNDLSESATAQNSSRRTPIQTLTPDPAGPRPYSFGLFALGQYGGQVKHWSNGSGNSLLGLLRLRLCVPESTVACQKSSARGSSGWPPSAVFVEAESVQRLLSLGRSLPRRPRRPLANGAMDPEQARLKRPVSAPGSPPHTKTRNINSPSFCTPRRPDGGSPCSLQVSCSAVEGYRREQAWQPVRQTSRLCPSRVRFLFPLEKTTSSNLDLSFHGGCGSQTPNACRRRPGARYGGDKSSGNADQIDNALATCDLRLVAMLCNFISRAFASGDRRGAADLGKQSATSTGDLSGTNNIPSHLRRPINSFESLDLPYGDDADDCDSGAGDHAGLKSIDNRRIMWGLFGQSPICDWSYRRKQGARHSSLTAIPFPRIAASPSSPTTAKGETQSPKGKVTTSGEQGAHSSPCHHHFDGHSTPPFRRQNPSFGCCQAPSPVWNIRKTPAENFRAGPPSNVSGPALLAGLFYLPPFFASYRVIPSQPTGWYLPAAAAPLSNARFLRPALSLPSGAVP
ncbi:hypothetical protein BDK51DRAFT_40849 [Blyttiomyces helicus]|uniref:Uncharacterized protein n=1 Tax=Blyttiomyces helicus TaxID=388810 RepID=A0A4P9WC15_9FUNG|nr:hypothetical protein BDK51DRAFT_40849 [Blyttiomyces helicus]|eukprot:RKO89842.1 hypothetical protein BDK51DRAFT_40849 [Blyttiomyces helicus]